VSNVGIGEQNGIPIAVFLSAFGDVEEGALVGFS